MLETSTTCRTPCFRARSIWARCPTQSTCSGSCNGSKYHSAGAGEVCGRCYLALARQVHQQPPQPASQPTGRVARVGCRPHLGHCGREAAGGEGRGGERAGAVVRGRLHAVSAPQTHPLGPMSRHWHPPERSHHQVRDPSQGILKRLGVLHISQNRHAGTQLRRLLRPPHQALDGCKVLWPLQQLLHDQLACGANAEVSGVGSVGATACPDGRCCSCCTTSAAAHILQLTAPPRS